MKRLLPIFSLFLASIFFSSMSLFAVHDPEIIQWKNNDGITFIQSVYQGVLGRAPTNDELRGWNTYDINTKSGKVNLFWTLTNSYDYYSDWGHLPAKYYVYWEARQIENNLQTCHCYYFAEFASGYMPSLQYIGVNCPSGPFNFRLARAVTLMYAAFDKETCLHYDCGYTDPPTPAPEITEEGDIDEIPWKTMDNDLFVRRSFQVMLNRQPRQDELQDWLAINMSTKNSRARLFWALVGSNEFVSIAGQLPVAYYVYWTAESNNNGYSTCHCYKFSKSTQGGYMPSLQYIGVNCPMGPFNFRVAQQLQLMYAAFDSNNCTDYSCGFRSEEYSGMSYEDCVNKICPECKNSVSLLDFSAGADCEDCKSRNRQAIEDCTKGSTTASIGNNLVRDMNFSGFGQNNIWSHGNSAWWNSGMANTSAQMVNLPASARPSPEITTALLIKNMAGRGPHVYGTTAQKIKVTKGQPYDITLWASAKSLASHSGLLLSVDPQWRIRPVRLDAGTYGWKKFTGTFTATSSEVQLRIISEDKGEVFITGIMLSPHFY